MGLQDIPSEPKAEKKTSMATSTPTRSPTNSEGANSSAAPSRNEWQANWGIATGTVKPCTFVVDTENMKIYVKEGENTVTFSGREPQFSAK